MDIRRNPLTGVPVVVAPGRSTRPGALGRTTRIADAATCPFCEGHEAMTPPEVLALGRAGGDPDTPGLDGAGRAQQVPGDPRPGGGRARPRARDGLRRAVAGSGDHRTRGLERAPRPLHAKRGRARLPAGGDQRGPGRRRVPRPLPLPARPVRRDPACGRGRDAGLRRVVCAVRRGGGRGRPHGPTSPAACARSPRPGAGSPTSSGSCPSEHTGQPADPDALAAALLDATRRLRAVLGEELAWNAVLHAAPLRGGDPYHWHIEIWPRLTVAASVELGAGVWVNIVDPDVAARELRSASAA